MKYFVPACIAIILVTRAITAMAYENAPYAPYHNPPKPHPKAEWRNGEWIIPAIIGGAIVYGLSHQDPSPPIYVQPNTPTYTKQWVYDRFCNCYKEIFVQVQ